MNYVNVNVNYLNYVNSLYRVFQKEVYNFESV